MINGMVPGLDGLSGNPGSPTYFLNPCVTYLEPQLSSSAKWFVRTD